MKKTLLTLSLASVCILSFAAPVLAQGNPGNGGPGNVPISFQIQNPFKVGNDLFALMESILTNIVMPLGGILCVLAFIWGGFSYIKAQGNPGEIAKANKTILYAAIGTAILLGALTIETLIRTTFNSIIK